MFLPWTSLFIIWCQCLFFKLRSCFFLKLLLVLLFANRPMLQGCIILQYLNQVWSLVRRFDQPEKYKPFVSRCISQGNLEIGSLREVDVRSGLPATTSTERLELLNDEDHILCVRIVGGDHRLRVFIYSFLFCYLFHPPICFFWSINLTIFLSMRGSW